MSRARSASKQVPPRERGFDIVSTALRKEHGERLRELARLRGLTVSKLAREVVLDFLATQGGEAAA